MSTDEVIIHGEASFPPMDAKRDGLREFTLAGKRSEESPHMKRQFPARLRPFRPLGGQELTMSEDHGMDSRLPGCQPRRHLVTSWPTSSCITDAITLVASFLL